MSMIPEPGNPEDGSPRTEPDLFAQPPAPLADPPPESRSEPTAAPVETPYRVSWQNRLLGISFAIFAFEIGLFLVIFPWMGDAWDLNYFQSGLLLRNLWDEPYFRGAVSGVGFLNIYIGLLQVGRLLRRSA
jgi:hypothetical protein